MLHSVANIEEQLLIVSDRFGFSGESLSDLVEWFAGEEPRLEDLAQLSVRMEVQHVGLVQVRPFEKRSGSLLFIVAG